MYTLGIVVWGWNQLCPECICLYVPMVVYLTIMKVHHILCNPVETSGLQEMKLCQSLRQLFED